MRVIVLATDEIAKLQPITNSYPSPLVPIVNRPVAAITFELLSRAGIKQPLVSVCHRGGKIISRIGTGLRWGMQIEYVFQNQALGSAGALRWAAPKLNETFLVLCADSILNLDIDGALAFHQAHGGAATLVLHAPYDMEIAHPVAFDQANRIRQLGVATGDVRTWSFTGAMILEPHLLELIPAGTHTDSYHDFIPALLASGIAVYAYITHGYWNPLATLEAYQAAQHTFLRSIGHPAKDDRQPQENALPMRAPSLTGQLLAPHIWIDRTTVVHPSARLIPPVYIGGAGRIGRDVVLGPNAILCSNVVVDDEATVADSIILEHTYIGRLIKCVGRIVDRTTLIDIASSQNVQIVDPFLLAEIVPAARLRRLYAIFSRLGGLCLLILLLPLLFVIGGLVFATSRGSILCKRPRTGVRVTIRSATPTIEPDLFDLYAFRTQRADGTYSCFGRWLSRWSLDRLPEFWNVVKGDIALVGVKPLPPETANHLHTNWQRKWFEYPAGLTGLWYTNTAADATFDDNLIADAYYVATQSRREDLRILRCTPIAWWRRGKTAVQLVTDSENRQSIDHLRRV